MLRVRDLLEEATGILQACGLQTARLDAERLLRLAAGRTRVWLLTHPEVPLPDSVTDRFRSLVTRRADRYPLQYLEGSQEFFGRDFLVDERVLIPRPETELLIEVSLRLLDGIPAPRAIDVGTGSGCLAVTLACELPRSQIFAGDNSPGALELAQENARRLGVENRIDFRLGEALNPFAGTRPVDLILSNPPYVAEGDPKVEESVRRFEPFGAVFAGPSGLEVYSQILESAGGLLASGGPVVFEIGYGQRQPLAAMAARLGWSVFEVEKDLAGIERCTVLKFNS